MRLLTKENKEEHFYNENNTVVCKISTTIYKIQFDNEAEYMRFVAKNEFSYFVHSLRYENLGDFTNPDYRWVGTFTMIIKEKDTEWEAITKISK